MSNDLPSPDQVGDAPHPSATLALYGQDQAQNDFLSAWGAGRLHHAWLLTGPRGIGKATLAYRMARTRLANDDDEDGLFGAPEPPHTLAMEADHPIMRRILAGAEPRLFTLRRTVNQKTNKLNTVIRVDDVRKLKDFFQLSAADGGWRVAVVDAAEEMNVSAANALLKFLEEPPAKTMLILISHAPAQLLPTIRSRCRTLNLHALSPDNLAKALETAEMDGANNPALAALSGGSAGEAIRLNEGGGLTLYARIVRLMTGAPGMDRPEMISIAEACMGRDAESTYDLTVRLVDLCLSRLAIAGAAGPPVMAGAPDEPALMQQLSASPAAARLWADTAAQIASKTASARAVNLDPAQVMLDTFFEIDATAQKARGA
ncbi:MAG: DNA polymerase III subunit delta' [Pikeienuella sp.]